MKYVRYITIIMAFAFVISLLAGQNPALAATDEELMSLAKSSLNKLYAKSPRAKELSQKAKAILVFPKIVKGGFIVGGMFGKGVLLKDGKIAGYYNTVAASYGLQVGVQKYGYALFFMTDESLKYLDKSGGWELGTAPSIVIADEGVSGGISTTSAQSNIYAFFFDQKGLMGGLGLQGTKITKVDKL